jgi:Tol biopolymer transport system component
VPPSPRHTLPSLAPPLIALALLTACSGSGSPPASSSETGLHFLIASEQGLVEVTDGEERVIVRPTEGSYFLDPAVSSDGEQIAYVVQPPATTLPGGGVDFGSDLYIVPRRGGDPRLVLKHAAVAEFIRAPSWLPDGNLLVAIRGRDPTSGAFDLHVVSVDPRSGQKRRFIDNAVDPVVSPDGRSLLYVSIAPDTQEEQLVLNDMGLSQRRPLAGTAQNLALIASAVWSPDGSQIAFTAVDITEPPTPLPGATQQPGIAPGGLRFHPFASDIWLVNRDGTNLRRLAELTDNQPSLDWSADGSTLYALGVTGFWQIDVATGDRQPLPYDAPLGQIRWLAR